MAAERKSRPEPQEQTMWCSNDFFAVALFSGIGLLISVVAIFCSEQGVWL
jgi:predicted acetyltransferase